MESLVIWSFLFGLNLLGSECMRVPAIMQTAGFVTEI